jgi:ADP-dependent NAD(P)H-hydrate dehydratase / NAD(P)H-hydrate epimerase
LPAWSACASSTGRAARAEARLLPAGDIALLELDDERAARLLPDRSARSHKGSHGRLVCLAGSPDYAGAALLAGLAAARLGTGLVALAVPRALQPVVVGRVPELVTIGLPDDAEAAAALIEARQPTALLVGPGLGEDEGQAALLDRLIARTDPMVIDGGGLNLLARSGEWWQRARGHAVLTPHPGEFARLDGSAVGDDDRERLERCTAAAQRWGQVVVLKGARTVVAAPDGQAARVPFQNAALASAGTGDVLAGAIGGLLAQGVAPFEAACLGVYLHGAAGERIAERLGDSGLLASDLPLEMALARAQLARRRRGQATAVGFGRREETLT